MQTLAEFAQCLLDFVYSAVQGRGVGGGPFWEPISPGGIGEWQAWGAGLLVSSEQLGEEGEREPGKGELHGKACQVRLGA